MLRWTGVNRLIRSSMHGEVRLLIAVYVKYGHSNPACDVPLENGSANYLSLPLYFARKSDVDGQELHAAVAAK